MAETGGLFVIDGEDAGSTPWEFDSLSEEGGNTIALAAAAKNNGDNGYKITFDGSSDFAYGIKSFSEQTDMYIRTYIYIPSGFEHGGTFSRLYAVELRDAGVLVCRIGFRSGATTTPAQWALDWRFTQLQSSTNFSLDAWHYIEMRFLQDGASGGAQMWVDGDSILTDMDQDSSSYAPDSVRYGSSEAAANPVASDFFYVDDLKADTSPVGAYSAGVPMPIYTEYYRKMRDR